MNNDIKRLIEQAISALDFNFYPKELYKPMAYILSLKAKRLRPLFAILSYKLFKTDYKLVLPSAILIEVFHNFTLIHDDILDKSLLRRNQPTVNNRWNNNVALLAGDALLIKLYMLLYEHLKILDALFIFPLFSECALKVCEGQQLDINFETNSNISVQNYLDMIELKTARLIAFSMQFGALLAKTSKENTYGLYQVGRSIGMAFQLQDDWLDTFGDQAKFGKPIGQDILNNKKTILLVQALEKAKTKDRQLLDYWLKQNDDNQSEAKIQTIRKLYIDLGIRESSKAMINQYFKDALNHFKTIDAVSAKAKVNFKDTIMNLKDRAL